MADRETILRWAEELRAYTVECRRTIHRYAELGGKEVKTSALIRGEMEKAGLPVRAVGATGLIGELDTGRPGRCLVLRADMDALPIAEAPDNLKGPRTCVSERPDTCHACGHDAHCAMLLAAMRALCGMQDQLSGKILFCFEAAEEIGGGWRDMLSALEEYPVDGAWGIHVYANLDSGKISVEPGPRMGGAAGVDITIRGRGGHGSRPDLSINPLFPAAGIITNAGAAFANQIDAEETVTLGITTLQCGSDAGNVIAEKADIKGSMRFFSHAEGEKAVEILKEVATHTAAMYHCTAEFGPSMRLLIDPVVTDQDCAGLAAKALKELLPEGTVGHAERWYASDSFGRYLSKYPGVYAFLGIRNEACGSGAQHHNQYFDVDEQVLPIGLIATVGYAAAFLEQTGKDAE